MTTLHLIMYPYLLQYTTSILDLFSILAPLCAILVIINKNPIVSILFLIGLFIVISGYLLTLGMKFIGISYLLVYIGAVSILFLFILMLINIRISEIQTETNNSLPLAIVISLPLYVILYPISSSNLTKLLTDLIGGVKPTGFLSYSTDYVTSNQWDNNIVETLHISSIGNVIYTNYFLWLMLASIILLLAMVGTIIITIKSVNKEPKTSSFRIIEYTPFSTYLNKYVVFVIGISICLLLFYLLDLDLFETAYMDFEENPHKPSTKNEYIDITIPFLYFIYRVLKPYFQQKDGSKRKENYKKQ